MCGIVGYVGPRNLANVILVGLERLEYRGYDSCGIAAIDGGLTIRKTAGRLQRLKEMLATSPVTGNLGVGHTRWATHGKVTDENAHPFTGCYGRMALVHNGIIENYRELRQRLSAEGHRFVSETDTETIVHLIESHHKQDLVTAVRKAAAELVGSYAIVVVSADEPDRLVAMKVGSPLVIGQGEGEHVIASDAQALVGIARRMVPMHDGDVAVVTRKSLELTDASGKRLRRQFAAIELKPKALSKGRYQHFMRKEIFEQPQVIADSIEHRFRDRRVMLDPEFLLYPDEVEKVARVVIQACGTSYHAGLVGRYYFEKFCRIPVSVEISSELRTSEFIYDGDTLMIPISQSGETADTLAALREAGARDIHSLAVLNTKRSSIDRESNSTVYIHAGPEIGVASTKAYTAEILTLLSLALYFARVRKTMPDDRFDDIVHHCRELPSQMRKALALDARIKATAERLAKAHDFLFLGRGINYPSALEGALKLKEVAYVHATGLPAGEMKHGPIALIAENVPVIGIVPRDSVYDKMISNLAESKARKGFIIAIGTEGDDSLKELADTVFTVPAAPEYLMPLLVAVPLQLFAYHSAVIRGCDVDKPRNLAKSVTVE
ncbi:glutamine--fructose-6-phosphate transaminase (isomerizing) [candidate division WOR-3 bacterium]|nr:glutamine--fructose-6-phosphate transaminase (isomerizing) [candidate division WOR-3 bacterium]